MVYDAVGRGPAAGGPQGLGKGVCRSKWGKPGLIKFKGSLNCWGTI